ncbi:MAG TPA: L,D-transpeptidase family protein [Roseomonas sp.]|jgi:murein L,D-transpeptidase YcbB/YkuD
MATPGSFAASDAALLALAGRLRNLGSDGLDPAWYPIPDDALATSDNATWRSSLAAATDAALTDLLLGRGRFVGGRADIRRDAGAHPLAPWRAEIAAAADPASVIERAALLPPEAAALRTALAAARAIAARGPFPAIPTDGPATIEPGSTDARRIPLLRRRLAMEDAALAALAGNDSPVYDQPLVDAVKRWQEREGFEADGRIGRITLTALNQPAETRVNQLRVNLDMRRGLAAPETERRIEVNLPHQRLRLLDGTRETMAMNVIVGRSDRATPLLRVRMVAIQFNPTWGVPERNARDDLLPRFRRDPAGMQARGFRLYQTVDGQRTEVDATTLDWSSFSRTNFPYFIRQDAGDANALGRIKFIMPNGDDIYMHDTPDRHLFRRPDRAFSSGCIRLERPMDMLDAALSGTPGWDRERAQRVLDSRATAGVTIARSIPVALLYSTAMVQDGRVSIRQDIYGYDRSYMRAMEAGDPRQRVAARNASR